MSFLKLENGYGIKNVLLLMILKNLFSPDDFKNVLTPDDLSLKFVMKSVRLSVLDQLYQQ
jgi:hypothetical protein